MGGATSNPARKIDAAFRARGKRFATDTGARIACFHATPKHSVSAGLRPLKTCFDREDNRGNGRSPGCSGGSIARLFPKAILEPIFTAGAGRLPGHQSGS